MSEIRQLILKIEIVAGKQVKVQNWTSTGTFIATVLAQKSIESFIVHIFLPVLI